jgi:integrase
MRSSDTKAGRSYEVPSRPNLTGRYGREHLARQMILDARTFLLLPRYRQRQSQLCARRGRDCGPSRSQWLPERLCLGWMFRTSPRNSAKVLTDRPLTQANAWLMIRRRAIAAGITAPIGCHTFRATGITAYLANGGALDATPRWLR